MTLMPGPLMVLQTVPRYHAQHERRGYHSGYPGSVEHLDHLGVNQWQAGQ
jgi:hypothetical protein